MAKVGDSWIPKDSPYYQRMVDKGYIKQHFRIPVSSKEKTAYIKLRKLGYTINTIAKAFGRSTSIIHRTLTNAWMIMKKLRLNDMRKIPNRVRILHAQYSPRTLQKYLQAWERWILSPLEEEPP